MQSVVSEHLAGGSGLHPFTVPSPVTIEVDFAMTVHADHAAMAPGLQRAGPRTVAFRHEDYREIFRGFRTIFNLGGLE
jgi:D-aminopeptidase